MAYPETHAAQNHHASRNSDEEADAAIAEIVAEFGLRATIAAVLRQDGASERFNGGPAATLRAIQVVIRAIVFAPDAQLEAEIIALGAGIILGDKQTQTSTAEKYGITKQALNKRVIAFADAHKLPPSPFMKSLKARKNYALTNQPRIA